VVAAGAETSYWLSSDALNWRRGDIAQGLIHLTEFGFLLENSDGWTIREAIPWRFEISTDGEDWHQIALPEAELTGDPARDAWWHADGRIFVTIETWSGERIIWMGRFTDGGRGS
jgi:hypothetical protein